MVLLDITVFIHEVSTHCWSEFKRQLEEIMKLFLGRQLKQDETDNFLWDQLLCSYVFLFKPMEINMSLQLLVDTHGFSETLCQLHKVRECRPLVWEK